MPTDDNNPKPVYQDEFQSGVNNKVEDFGKKFEGKGRNILYGLAALAVLAVLDWHFFHLESPFNAAAQTALGKAIETSQAQVTDFARARRFDRAKFSKPRRNAPKPPSMNFKRSLINSAVRSKTKRSILLLSIV